MSMQSAAPQLARVVVCVMVEPHTGSQVVRCMFVRLCLTHFLISVVLFRRPPAPGLETVCSSDQPGVRAAVCGSKWCSL